MVLRLCRGRGLPLARGSGVGISPLGSNHDSDSAATPSGFHTDDAGDETGNGSRKHERDHSPDESQRRWKKKPPSNVDWMLKCRTKLLELKERTAKKAVSDVFMTERVWCLPTGMRFAIRQKQNSSMKSFKSYKQLELL